MAATSRKAALSSPLNRASRGNSKERALRAQYLRDQRVIARVMFSPEGFDALKALLNAERTLRHEHELRALRARISGGQQKQLPDADLINLVRQRFRGRSEAMASMTLQQIASELIEQCWDLDGASPAYLSRRLGALNIRIVVSSADDNRAATMNCGLPVLP